MPIHVVQLEERPRRRREGLRIGAVRFVPMRKPKGSMYDVWLPELAPSKELLSQRLDLQPRQLLRRYGAEMRRSPVAKHLIALLAALSHETDLTIGCYCSEEADCHRSILRELLSAAGADVR